MGLFDDAIAEIKQEEQVIQENIQSEQSVILEKDSVLRTFDLLEAGYLAWKDYQVTYQTVLRNVYDPATGSFSAAIEPYLTEAQKNHIRGQFS